jgi:hypothetical protein
MSEQTMLVQLTEVEVALLLEALELHEYWQLSESHQRNNGYSTVEDGEKEEIDAARALVSNLERQTRAAV